MNSHGSSFWSSLELHAKHHYIQTLWILSTELPVSPGVQTGQQASYFIASTQLLQVWPSIFSSGALGSKHVDTSSVSSQYHSNDNNLGPLLHFWILTMTLGGSLLSQLYRWGNGGPERLSHFPQVTQLGGEGVDSNLGSLGILTLGSKYYVIWKGGEMITLQVTVNNYPRHTRALCGLQSWLLGLVYVLNRLYRGRWFYKYKPSASQLVAAQMKRELKLWSAKFWPKDWLLGGRGEKFPLPCFLPPTSPWLSLGPGLHLELMVHWLATVPGATSYDICRYI